MVAQHYMEGVGMGKLYFLPFEVGKTSERPFREKCLY